MPLLLGPLESRKSLHEGPNGKCGDYRERAESAEEHRSLFHQMAWAILGTRL